jgi:predicted transcriptional regulator
VSVNGWSLAEIERVIALYRAGLTVEEIASNEGREAWEVEDTLRGWGAILGHQEGRK